MGEKVNITDTQYENNFTQTCVRERVESQRGQRCGTDVMAGLQRSAAMSDAIKRAVATVFFTCSGCSMTRRLLVFQQGFSWRTYLRFYGFDGGAIRKMLNNIVRASRRTTRHTAAESTSCLASSASGVEPQAPRLNVWVEKVQGNTKTRGS
jgi:hypothetical protein